MTASDALPLTILIPLVGAALIGLCHDRPNLREGVTLESLVDGLNALGVGPRDMISILQTIRAAGALQAELEVL